MRVFKFPPMESIVHLFVRKDAHQNADACFLVCVATHYGEVSGMSLSLAWSFNGEDDNLISVRFGNKACKTLSADEGVKCRVRFPAHAILIKLSKNFLTISGRFVNILKIGRF